MLFRAGTKPCKRVKVTKTRKVFLGMCFSELVFLGGKKKKKPKKTTTNQPN